LEASVIFFETPFVDQQGKAFFCPDPEVVVAFGTDLEVSLHLQFVDDLLAAIALDPEAIGNPELAFLDAYSFLFFSEPDHSPAYSKGLDLG
jgi:hypothetical protein